MKLEVRNNKNTQTITSIMMYRPSDFVILFSITVQTKYPNFTYGSEQKVNLDKALKIDSSYDESKVDRQIIHYIHFPPPDVTWRASGVGFGHADTKICLFPETEEENKIFSRPFRMDWVEKDQLYVQFTMIDEMFKNPVQLF